MTTEQGDASHAASRSIWSFLSWTAVVFCWSLFAACLVLLVCLLILRVTEVGPYGAVLLLGAAAILLARCAWFAAPRVRAIAGRVKPRFSLRTLLVATAVGGIALAWFGNWLRDEQRQLLI